MFRRKEESLFDNEQLPEENESFIVQAPAAAGTAPVVAVAAVPVVAPSTASVQPITRPASPAPAAAFRTSAPTASAAAATPSFSRPTEVKPMTPISSATTAQSATKTGNRVLTVGNDILLKGEITACDRLLIEGKVEATVSDVNALELAECGSFKGSANVVDAHISGTFDGDLVVTGRLIIHSSGTVSGNISYGEIEIERGGQLTGQIKSVGTSSIPKALRKEAA